MSATEAGGSVHGFFDLASGLAGLSWRLGTEGGLILSDGNVSAANPSIAEEDDGHVVLGLSSGDVSLEATLEPRVKLRELEPAEGHDPITPPLEAAACQATVKLDGGRSLQCPGHVSRWQGDPLEGAGALRHLAIEGPEGSLLIAWARGEQGIDGHGEERVEAWRLDGEGGSSAFGESLISTQYDGDGSPTRIGLELWPQGEEQTLRAAATRPAGSRLGGSEDGEISAALFRCHTDEAEGLGSYVLWRG